MKEFDVLRREILQKIYPDINSTEFNQVISVSKHKELMRILYWYGHHQLNYILDQINNFDCWYKEQTLTDDLLNKFCKNAGWTVDEVTSIILGKNPKNVSIDSLTQRLEEIFKIRDLDYKDKTKLNDNILDHPIIKYYYEQWKQIDLAITFEEITDIKTGYLDGHRVSLIPPQKVLKWCKEKEIKLPNGIEELIKQYHDYEDKEIKYQKLKAENQELKKEKAKSLVIIEELNKKIVVLELDKPNTKIFNSYKQLAMGMLAVRYGEEQVKIWQNWVNSTATNKTIPEQKLKFSEIQDTLAGLNLPAIKIKRDTIRERIKESIELFRSKDIKH